MNDQKIMKTISNKLNKEKIIQDDEYYEENKD